MIGTVKFAMSASLGQPRSRTDAEPTIDKAITDFTTRPCQHHPTRFIRERTAIDIVLKAS
jgi:hypothetical protein